MGTALDRIFLYRQLLGRCHGNQGLDFDEIDLLTQLEAEFAPRVATGRRPAGRVVNLKAMLRGRKLGDTVALVEIGLDGVVCRMTPYVEEGEFIELLVDDDDRDLSFRFKVRVAWLRDDVNDDFALGLEFVGVPVRVHYGPASDSTYNLVHRIAA